MCQGFRILLAASALIMATSVESMMRTRRVTGCQWDNFGFKTKFMG
jgi:hypothetical protein